MANTQRRWTYRETERNYFGEDEASPLIAWLNTKENPEHENAAAVEEAKADIAKIVDDFAELTALPDSEVVACRSIVARINATLSACAILPQVYLDERRPLTNLQEIKVVGCYFDYEPAPGTKHFAELREREIGKLYSAISAHQMFMLLFSIWKSGNIAKLRRCVGCGDFLYKRFSNQSACSDRCRENAYKRSREFKDNRNKRLRMNRANNKKRNAK